MSFWEKNSSILRRCYGKLLDELISENEDFPYEIKIETALSGDPTLSVNGLYIHSQRDPVREGQKTAKTILEGKNAVIILGFGLGYTAQYIAKNNSVTEHERPLIIVEKHKKLLRMAFELRDLSDLLSSKNIIFVTGGSQDGITDALLIANKIIKNDDDKTPPVIIRSRTLTDLDSLWYKNIEDKIRVFSMKDKVNTATQKRFAARWVRNIIRNIRAARDVPGINLLTQRGAEFSFPVFLAAAGPSLDKIKPLLRDIYNRCIIVAVDTSLRFFNRNGIQPDFVITVDPQFWNSRHLDYCDYEKTALIAESAVYPPVFNLPFKRKFLCGSLFALGTFVENRVDPKGRLAAGGSVATTAWDFARTLISANPSIPQSPLKIWIAGLDLAYPGFKTHFHGAKFEEKANSESNRFNPVETWIVRTLGDGIPFLAKSAKGSQVLTDRRLSLYAAWFENQFSQHKNIQNQALFQEGLSIKGLTDASAEQLLGLPVCRREIDVYLETVYTEIDNNFNNPNVTRKRHRLYDKAINDLITQLNGFAKAAKEGDTLVRQTLENINSGAVNSERKESVTKELDRITQKIADSEIKDIVGFLMPADEDVADSGEDPFQNYLKTSLKMFSSLSESAEYILKLFSNLSQSHEAAKMISTET